MALININSGSEIAAKMLTAKEGDVISINADMTVPGDLYMNRGTTLKLNGHNVKISDSSRRGFQMTPGTKILDGKIIVRDGGWGFYSYEEGSDFYVEGINIEGGVGFKFGGGNNLRQKNITVKDVVVKGGTQAGTVCDMGPSMVENVLIDGLFTTSTQNENATWADGIAIEYGIGPIVVQNSHIGKVGGDGIDIKSGNIYCRNVVVQESMRQPFKFWGRQGEDIFLEHCMSTNCGYNNFCGVGNIKIIDSHFEGGILDASAFNLGSDHPYPNPVPINRYGLPDDYGSGWSKIYCKNTNFIRKSGSATLISCMPDVDITFDSCKFFQKNHYGVFIGNYYLMEYDAKEGHFERLYKYDQYKDIKPVFINPMWSDVPTPDPIEWLKAGRVGDVVIPPIVVPPPVVVPPTAEQRLALLEKEVRELSKYVNERLDTYIVNNEERWKRLKGSI